MNFIEFVNSHKAEAFKIRINYDAIDKLEEMQQKFRDAESPEELQEVRDFAKKAINEIKAKIQKMLRNEIHLTTYQNVVPPYLPFVRMWFEYKELYEKTEEPKKSKKKPEELENFDKIEEMLDRAGFKNIEGLQTYLSATNFKNKSLALLIFGITSKAVDHYKLKAFMRWMNKESQYTGVSRYLEKDDQGYNRFEYPDGYVKKDFDDLLESIKRFGNFD